MGNSASVEDSADLQSLCQSVRGLQVENDDLIITSATGHHRLNYYARQKLRSHLFACSTEELAGSSQNTPFASAESVGRSASSKSAINSKERGNVDMSEVLGILKEIRKSASPDELIALQKALLPSSTDIVPPDSPDASPSSKKSGKSRNLLRRASFATPGVATRQSQKIMRKPAPSAPEPARTWSEEMFGQSPLSKLAGWESENNGLAERAITPDINYLGIHELGSLRVTNGAVSPDPSILRDMPKESSTLSLTRDDYFTASEGSSTGSPDKQSTRSAQSPGEDSIVTLENHSASSQRYEAGDGVGAKSPLKQDRVDLPPSTEPPLAPRRYTRDDEDTPVIDDSLNRARSMLKLYHHVANSNPFLSADLDEESVTDDANEDGVSPLSPKAQPVDMYQLEATSNPFLPLKNNNYNSNYAMMSEDSWRQESISSTGSSLDDTYSFDETMRTPRLGLYSEALNNSNTNNLQSVYPEYKSVASSIYTSGSRKEKSEPTEISKVDSGYHSQTSLRTFDEPDRTVERVSTNKNAPSDDHQLIRMSKEPSNQSIPLAIPYNMTTTGEPPDLAPKPVSPLKSPVREKKTSTAVETSPASTNTVIKHGSPISTSRFLVRAKSTPVISTMTENLKPKSTPKKLQKKNRPKSARMAAEPVVVQSVSQVQREASALPQIPNELSSRYTQRVSQQPNMEHLDKTFKSVSHCDSRDSFTSFQPFNIQNLRFPSPTRSPEQLVTAESSTGPRRHSFGAEKYMRELFRGKPRLDDEQRGRSHSKSRHPHMTIEDFGTVTTSLGSSPYDLATSSNVNQDEIVKKKSSRPRSLHGPRQLTHPYQMGANLPYSKQFAGMSDEDASAFALKRSRDAVESFDGPLPGHSHREMAGNPEIAPCTSLHGRSKSNFEHGSKNSKFSVAEKSSFHGPRELNSERKDVQKLPTSENRSSQRDIQEHSKPKVSETDAVTPGPTQTQGNTDGWGDYAKAWRERRKSIGENLSRGVQTHDKEQETLSTDRKSQTAYAPPPPNTTAYSRQPPAFGVSSQGQRWNRTSMNGNTQKPLPKDPTRTPNRSSRAPSPTPSVLERAAVFERGMSQQPRSQPTSSRQSPTRQPHQSPRNWPPEGPSTRSNRSGQSPYRAAISSSPVTPSGVASAYTTSQASNYKASRNQNQSEPPKLILPRKRPSWPTSAFPQSTFSQI